MAASSVVYLVEKLEYEMVGLMADLKAVSTVESMAHCSVDS